MIHYNHYDPNMTDFDKEYDYWYDVDGERIGKCSRINASGLEEFTLFLRDESGNVLTEFKTNQCPVSPTVTEGRRPDFTWEEDYYYFGGKLASAEEEDLANCSDNNSQSDITFYHSDHIGSPRVITYLNKPTGTGDYGYVKAFHVYWPYGEEITNQTQDDLTHRYTGHERDFESNLDYMHARYYSPFQGRFLGVDEFA